MGARKLISVGWVLGAFALFLGAGAASASAASAPTVVREWSEDVVYSTALFKSIVIPNEAETTFRFEYGTDTSYGASVPVPAGHVGSGSGAVEVGEEVDGLQAGAVYHYRVVASNAQGTTYGPDKTFTTFGQAGAPGADTCPNAAYRTGLSAHLPDCRAYEMVSPVDKNGADVIAHQYGGFAGAASGERIAFGTRTGMNETKGSGFGGYSEFMASRGSERWSSKGVMPTVALSDPLQLFTGATKVLDFSTDFDRAVVLAYDLPGIPGPPPEVENLYLENTVENNVLEAVTRFEGFEEPVSYFSWGVVPRLGGGSSDLGVVTFQMTTNLVPQAKGSATKVYMLDHGTVKLVSVLPDGTLPAEAELVREPHGSIAYKDTVSEDGSRALFYATPEGGERELYMRKNGTSTVLVSESEASEATPAQKPYFLAATPDDTKVLFSTQTRLLDTDPGGPGMALYRYTDGPNPKSESNLTFVARFADQDQEIYGLSNDHSVVKGMSDDASHIYFYSEHALSLPAKTKGEGLYLWDEGRITQVAPQPGAQEEFAFNREEEAFVSANGHRIAFKNQRALLASQDILNPIAEVYLYDEDTDSLRCVSCPTTGAAAISGAENEVEGTKPTNPAFLMDQVHRFFTHDGRFVFFNTSEALVPEDVNELPDAYEYNVETGKLSLLSTGTGEVGAWFVEAGTDGRDVFLATRQRLSRWDPDALDDLYDARSGGGLPEPPVPTTPCDGDACQGTPSTTPSFNTASEFSGLGNLAPAPKATNRKVEKRLTRAQLRKRALAQCKKKRPRRKRIACEAAARKRYAAKKPVKRSPRAGR